MYDGYQAYLVIIRRDIHHRTSCIQGIKRHVGRDSRDITLKAERRLPVVEPVKRQLISIRVPGLRGVKHNRFSERVRNLEDAARAVDHSHGLVVRLRSRVGSVVDSPLHAGGKVELVGLPPAPDAGELAEVRLVVDADGPVGRVAEGALGARRHHQDVPAAPSAPLRVLRCVEPVGDQAQEGRGVALHDEGPVQVVRAQGPDADVLLEPLVAHEGRVWAALVEVPVPLARDALIVWLMTLFWIINGEIARLTFQVAIAYSLKPWIDTM